MVDLLPFLRNTSQLSVTPKFENLSLNFLINITSEVLRSAFREFFSHYENHKFTFMNWACWNVFDSHTSLTFPAIRKVFPVSVKQSSGLIRNSRESDHWIYQKTMQISREICPWLVLSLYSALCDNNHLNLLLHSSFHLCFHYVW